MPCVSKHRPSVICRHSMSNSSWKPGTEIWQPYGWCSAMWLRPKFSKDFQLLLISADLPEQMLSRAWTPWWGHLVEQMLDMQVLSTARKGKEDLHWEAIWRLWCNVEGYRVQLGPGRYFSMNSMWWKGCVALLMEFYRYKKCIYLYW